MFIDDSELNITSVYAPTTPRERKVFFNNLWTYKTGDTNILIGGDFNCVTNPDKDKRGGNPLSGTVGTKELRTFYETLQLKDVWREKHRNDNIFTWHNKDFTLRSRLDRWYISETLVNRSNSHIRACPYSDHSTVEIQIQTERQRSRGKGVWKMNTNLLKDKHFLRETIAVIKLWKKQIPQENINDWWDDLKCKIKALAIKHSIKKSRNRHKALLKLQRELTNRTNEPNPDINLVNDLERQIDDINTEKLRGVQIRSRAKWFENGERPTKYFFSLEKRKQPLNTITELTTQDGKITSNIDILEATRKFYQDLYTEAPVDNGKQEWFLHQLETSLSDIDKNYCEGQITEKELKRAIENMNRNKAPGPDGIPIEFYQHFSDDIVEPLIAVFNNNFEVGSMTESQRMAILRLLFKKNEKDRLKNWRPISLLNADYKILTTVLATRLKAVLPTVIDEDQTCGIKGRTIFENLFRLRDTIHAAKTNDNNLTIINIDQEKAFDRVNRSFLQKVLEKLNFGPSFRRWIEIIYHGARSQVLNNGWFSDPIQLNSGLRQGCPLSPLLYVIVSETLACAIRNDKHIEGILIPGSKKRSKISMYADDSTLTLKNDFSIQRSFDVIRDFEAASGSKLNLTKTEGIYIGSQAGRTHGPVPIIWKTDAIPVLGTKLGNDLSQDWEKAASKVEKNLERWSTRSLSLVGKVVLIKTYALASIIYLASVFTIPVPIISRLNKAVFTFLWSGGNELVSRETCMLPKEKGGLKIPDLKATNKAMKAKWIKHITDKEKEKVWLHYARYWIGLSLSTIKTNWKWLRTAQKPHADPAKIPVWYKTIKTTAQRHRATLAQLPTQKITAGTLTDLERIITPPRADQEWRRVTGKRNGNKEFWSKIWKTMNTNKEKETMWKTSHRVLTTKSYLKKWGMNISKKCPFCPRSEDLHHALLMCPRAKRLWQSIIRLIEAISECNIEPTFTDLLFEESFPNDKESLELTRYLVNATIHVIWTTRNKKVYDANEPEVDLYKETVNRIKNRIKLDGTICPHRVNQFWSYRNVLCSYDGSTINFNI